MTHKALKASTLICFVVGVSACRNDRYKYTPVPDNKPDAVTSADLGVQDSEFPECGSKVLDHAVSMGRFPTGLCVVQVFSAGDSTERRLHIAETETARSASWNQLISELPAIREVKIQRSTALDPRGARLQDLLRQSARQGCNLCMIYSKTCPADADAEYVGVLWDGAASKPLAVYRSPVLIPQCKRKTAEDDELPRPQRKIWLAEADFRAEADLRQMVLSTLWDLVTRDSADTTTKPNLWQSDQPLYPRNPLFRFIEPAVEKGK